MATGGLAGGSAGGCPCSPGGYGGPALRVLRHTLAAQRGVRIALPEQAVVERDVLLVAFAHLDRRCALARLGFAGNITNAADIHIGVLRDTAVQLAVGAVGIVLPHRDALLLHRQE